MLGHVHQSLGTRHGMELGLQMQCGDMPSQEWILKFYKMLERSKTEKEAFHEIQKELFVPECPEYCQCTAPCRAVLLPAATRGHIGRAAAPARSIQYSQ